MDLRALWGRKYMLGERDGDLGPPTGSGWRLDLPAVPGALTPAGVAWLQGLRQAFAELGAEAYDPGSKEWDPGQDSWLFAFTSAEPPPFDPRQVKPLPVARSRWGRGWTEAAPGIWVHPAADAVCWVRAHTVFARWPVGLYSLTWPAPDETLRPAEGRRSGQGPGHSVREPAAVTRVRRRLERLATNETELTAAPPGYVGRQYDWFKHGQRPLPFRP